jgi:hypothetical protein
MMGWRLQAAQLSKGAPAVILWTEHGLDAGARLREVVEFVRSLFRA